MKITLYKALIALLEEHQKTIEDVEFISSHQEDDEENEFEIPMRDFITYSKKIEAVDGSLAILIVGKDFWVTSDTDDGYFKFMTAPKRPRRIINIAEQLLLDSENKNVGAILGLKAEYEKW